MKQFRLMFDKDREIEYLNEMCAKGWALKRFKYGLYTFEPCKPGEWQFDCDLNDRGFGVSREYRQILKDMDIEFLCTSGFWFWCAEKASTVLCICIPIPIPSWSSSSGFVRCSKPSA